MLRRLVAGLARGVGRSQSSLRSGQLDKRDFEALLTSIVEREGWQDGRRRIVVEIGTGGGRGSTAAIHRVLTAQAHGFQLVGYEGDRELARRAAGYWRTAEEISIVNEYFMRREDIDIDVKPHVAPVDRASYLPEFEALSRAENFLATPPPGPIDLLFIDSVRYTHLAILRAVRPWLQPETIVVMEDDIPGYGELAIVEGQIELRDVVRHEIAGHPWPLVEFKVGSTSDQGYPA